MTQEDKLLKAIFGEKSHRTDREEFEYNCLTIPGYESIFRLFSGIPKEDRKLYESDLMSVQASLVKAYNKEMLMESRAKRILRLISKDMPLLILNNEYRLFFEKYCKYYDIKLNEEDFEQ